MSQHHIQIDNTATSLCVCVGYDNPLSEFFLRIHCDDKPIYDSLSEFCDKDSTWLAKTLSSHGVALPLTLLNELALEAIFGGSNQCKDHARYSLDEQSAKLLMLGFLPYMENSFPQSNAPIWVWLPDDHNGQFMNVSSAGLQLIFPESLTPPELTETVKVCSEKTDAEMLALVNAMAAHLPIFMRGRTFQNLLGFTPCNLVTQLTDQKAD